MTYGIAFWGNSSDSKDIFILQKKAIRIITGVKPRESCKNLFRKLQILPMPCEYILSLLLLVIKCHQFKINSDIHSVNTRNKKNIHIPTSNLTCFQKGAYYMGAKMYNKLPLYIKSLSKDEKEFKKELKKYLLAHNFYSVDDYFSL